MVPATWSGADYLSIYLSLGHEWSPLRGRVPTISIYLFTFLSILRLRMVPATRSGADYLSIYLHIYLSLGYEWSPLRGRVPTAAGEV